MRRVLGMAVQPGRKVSTRTIRSFGQTPPLSLYCAKVFIPEYLSLDFCGGQLQSIPFKGLICKVLIHLEIGAAIENGSNVPEPFSKGSTSIIDGHEKLICHAYLVVRYGDFDFEG
jgi:hypothetical protein